MNYASDKHSAPLFSKIVKNDKSQHIVGAGKASKVAVVGVGSIGAKIINKLTTSLDPYICKLIICDSKDHNNTDVTTIKFHTDIYDSYCFSHIAASELESALSSVEMVFIIGSINDNCMYINSLGVLCASIDLPSIFINLSQFEDDTPTNEIDSVSKNVSGVIMLCNKYARHKEGEVEESLQYVADVIILLTRMMTDTNQVGKVDILYVREMLANNEFIIVGVGDSEITDPSPITSSVTKAFKFSYIDKEINEFLGVYFSDKNQASLNMDALDRTIISVWSHPSAQIEDYKRATDLALTKTGQKCIFSFYPSNQERIQVLVFSTCQSRSSGYQNISSNKRGRARENQRAFSTVEYIKGFFRKKPPFL